MTFSSAQRRYLEPRTLTVRPMRHYCGATTPQDRNIHSSSMMASEYSNRPNANPYCPFPAEIHRISTI